MPFLVITALFLVQLSIPALAEDSVSNYTLNADKMISSIFTEGKILQYVQMARIFNNSKTFVDLKLMFPPQLVKKKFDKILNDTNNLPSDAVLRDFVKSNFESGKSALVEYIPIDWNPKPNFLSGIYDSNLRDWMVEVNYYWKKLGRKVSEDVQKHNELYSLIYVPYPFIVPGGKFTEFYYWDSYWIIEGLLVSEMFLTAQQMIRNYLYLVDLFGYVPNGGNKCYLGRSQPPFLIPMFNLYYEFTKDKTFLIESIATLEKEFQFWKHNRTTNIKKDGISYNVFQYNVDMYGPRPEAYYEDVTNANKLPASSRNKFYAAIKSAAESGWDFSSRWFLSKGKRTDNLLDVDPKSLAPVCLNSLMSYNAKILSHLYWEIGDDDKADQYLAYNKAINQTVSRLFWSEEDGIWLDYNILDNRLQPGFYPSSLVPLWTETYGMERDKFYTIERVLNYLERINITGFIGGIPTSLMETNQQWDFPNGWAPLQHMSILGLRKAGNINERASDMAFLLAKHWLLNCFKTYKNSKPPAMYEKYNVIDVGIPGGGGEYTVQKGFGWTNGVAIKLLSIYGHKIEITHHSDPAALIVGLVLLFSSLITIINFIFRGHCNQKHHKRKSQVLLENFEEDFL